MKRAQTKFAKELPKKALGGRFSFDKQNEDKLGKQNPLNFNNTPGKIKRFDEGGLFSPAFSSTKAAGNMRLAGGLAGAAGTALKRNYNDPSLVQGADEQYAKDTKNFGQTNNVINGVSDGLLATGNPFLMAAGGVGKLVGGLFDFDKAARKRAQQALEKRNYDKSLDASNVAGNKNINSLPEYKAPAYGRRGLKLRKGPSMHMPGGMRMSFTSKFGKYAK